LPSLLCFAFLIIKIYVICTLHIAIEFTLDKSVPQCVGNREFNFNRILIGSLSFTFPRARAEYRTLYWQNFRLPSSFHVVFVMLTGTAVLKQQVNLLYCLMERRMYTKLKLPISDSRKQWKKARKYKMHGSINKDSVFYFFALKISLYHIKT
jgi:hypothetical protein